MKSIVLMVGPFPPPVHGMAAVNKAVQNKLRASGMSPEIIDVAAPNIGRSLTNRLGRLPRIFRGLILLALMRRAHGAAIYMSVSGGFGKLYEILFAMLGRLRGMRIFLHHHTYIYLDRPSWIAKLLFRVAGPGALHVALCPDMAGLLKTTYRLKRVVPVSNAVFLAMSPERKKASRRNLKMLGFLSNISPDKGVFEFMNLLDQVQKVGLPLQAKLAGPFQDKKTERQVRARLTKFSNVEYVGPKYDADKDCFFENIDVFVFPTKYEAEAEPLVIYEAMQHGLPIITYGRGCIPEIIDTKCGLVIPPDQPFAPLALEQIKKWLASPVLFESASRAAENRFTQILKVNMQCCEALKEEILDGYMNE